MKVGDDIRFDHMGKEHEGIILEITSSDGSSLSHDILKVKSSNHISPIVINVTLFPSRVRPNENR